MGICRDTDYQEIDVVKEMAEALGSTGLRLEEILEKIDASQRYLNQLFRSFYDSPSKSSRPDASVVNEAIRQHNVLVDQAQEGRRWLLIQREACGFRVHREVDLHYPIPAKIKLLE
jgi:hypothetical protein